MKIQQLQQNLEMAQQQEIQFKAQMEVRLKCTTTLSCSMQKYVKTLLFVKPKSSKKHSMLYAGFFY
jgi:hypothetical protein